METEVLQTRTFLPNGFRTKTFEKLSELRDLKILEIYKFQVEKFRKNFKKIVWKIFENFSNYFLIFFRNFSTWNLYISKIFKSLSSESFSNVLVRKPFGRDVRVWRTSVSKSFGLETYLEISNIFQTYKFLKIFQNCFL